MMFKVYKLVADAQYYSSNTDMDSAARANDCLIKLYSAFNKVVEEPYQSFRVETMSLFLDVFMSMQTIGPE